MICCETKSTEPNLPHSELGANAAHVSWKMQSAAKCRQSEPNYENKDLGSREFCEIANTIIIRGKLSMPSVINGFEVIASSSDTAKQLVEL